MQVVTCKNLSSLENKSPVAFYNIADEKAQKATEIYKSRNYYGNRIRRTLFGYHQQNKRTAEKSAHWIFHGILDGRYAGWMVAWGGKIRGTSSWTCHTWDRSGTLSFRRGQDGLYAADRRDMIPNAGYDIEEAPAVSIQFESRILGIMFSACFIQAGVRRSRLNIFCEDGTIEYWL